HGSRPSGPASTERPRARSATVGASVPIARRRLKGPVLGNTALVIGTRPWVGLSVAMPQKWAGTRRLPPESLPKPRGDAPAATIAASPPLLPPHVREVSNGLTVRP